MDSYTKKLIKEAERVFEIHPDNYITLSRYLEEVTDRVIGKNDISLVEKFQDILDWEGISRYFKFTEEGLDRFFDKLHKDLISSYQILSEEFIKRHKDSFDFIDWSNISRNQVLSSEFIYEHRNCLPPDEIFWQQIITPDLLDSLYDDSGYRDNIQWDAVSLYVLLDYERTSRYKDNIQWEKYSFFQPLINDEVIRDFGNRLDKEELKFNTSFQFRVRYKRGFDWFIGNVTRRDDYFNRDLYLLIDKEFVESYPYFSSRVNYSDLINPIIPSKVEVIRELNTITGNLYKRQ